MTGYVAELSPPSATNRRVFTAAVRAAWRMRHSPSTGTSGSSTSPRSQGARSPTSTLLEAHHVEKRASARRTAAGVACAPVLDSEVPKLGTPSTARSGARVPGPAASQSPARGHRGSRGRAAGGTSRSVTAPTVVAAFLYRGRRIEGVRPPARGRSAVGSASPCQGEGRGFESRRPLGDAPGRQWGPTLDQQVDTGFRGGMAEWLRQGPAKPCTRVRFPLPPRGTAQWRATAASTEHGRLAQSGSALP